MIRRRRGADSVKFFPKRGKEKARFVVVAASTVLLSLLSLLLKKTAYVVVASGISIVYVHPHSLASVKHTQHTDCLCRCIQVWHMSVLL